ncbi:hypothetical protein FOV72_03755 [Gordonia rubripertincta]|uniref:hypothetical protein n=1 Tax=Gordonia rubripertincta TaxID=36822 RepID=UPI00117E6052|nr:hypothetical protein [Gordonia rubripertincta]TSD98880.1 hypothetical protein FOV72_03755 [Gordonia rubripertincta]
MTIRTRSLTALDAAHARRNPRPATPPPTYSQAELRDRRRKHLPVTYDGRFDLTEEIRAIVGPLADRVATDPHPLAFAVQVDDVVVAVAGSVRTLAVLLAEREARRRTASVPVSHRGAAVRALVALADKPADPEITDDDIHSGRWAAILTEHAATYSTDLADYLAHAIPPGQTRGLLSISEQTEGALREIDTAAVNLARRLAYVENLRAQTRDTGTSSTEADRARETLASLGITP